MELSKAGAAAAFDLTGLPTIVPSLFKEDTFIMSGGKVIFSNGTTTDQVFYIERSPYAPHNSTKVYQTRGVFLKADPKLWTCCLDCFSSLPSGTG